MSIGIVMTPGPNIVELRRQQKISADKLNEPMTIKWGMGNPNPFREDIYNRQHTTSNKHVITPMEFLLNSNNVILLAYGKELEMIRTHMANIPFPINGIEQAFWIGDFAKFIALNFSW